MDRYRFLEITMDLRFNWIISKSLALSLGNVIVPLQLALERLYCGNWPLTIPSSKCCCQQTKALSLIQFPVRIPLIPECFICCEYPPSRGSILREIASKFKISSINAKSAFSPIAHLEVRWSWNMQEYFWNKCLLWKRNRQPMIYIS